MNIINPITGESYNLFSRNGKNLLKKYIHLYNTFQNGGTGTNEQREPDSLIYTFDNAKIHLIIEDTLWKKDDYYTDIEESFKSSIRIAGLYSQIDKSKPRAPKGLVRRRLCKLLLEMVINNKLKLDSIVVLEADPSVNNYLVKNVYEPMEFKLESAPLISTEERTYENGRLLEGGGLMSAKIEDILEWCVRFINPSGRKRGETCDKCVILG